MSYAWRIAGDALIDLRQLEIWLQEHVLDEVERASATPWRLKADVHGQATIDMDRFSADAWHILFINLHRDDARQLITLTGVGHQQRPRP